MELMGIADEGAVTIDGQIEVKRALQVSPTGLFRKFKYVLF